MPPWSPALDALLNSGQIDTVTYHRLLTGAPPPVPLSGVVLSVDDNPTLQISRAQERARSVMADWILNHRYVMGDRAGYWVDIRTGAITPASAAPTV